MYKKTILIFISLLLSLVASTQTTFVNSGKMNVSAGYLVIEGSYQNESSGIININGKITITENWTNNSTTNVINSPGTDGEVIFNGSGTQIIGGSANLFDFEKLTINSGSTTQVEAGKGVTAYGACTFTAPLVLKSTTGTFKPLMATFINNSTVSGNITMELFYKTTGSSAAGTGRGLYIAPPITNAVSTTLNVPTNVLFYQDEVNRKYVSITTSGVDLTNGKGYIFRSATDNLFSFTGTPKITNYATPNIPRVDANHYYLLGNPFLSVIDWDAIDKSNNISSTIWYRSCDATGKMVTADTWNSVEQTGTSNNGTAVDGKIPPLQSVWIQCASNGSGSLTIPLSVRTHSWGNARFLKSRAANQKDVVRLYLYSNDKRDEAVIIQSNKANKIFEDSDSRKFFNNDPVIAEVYTISPEKINCVIQSFKPLAQDSTVRLGINVGTEGDYKFVANLTEKVNAYNVYLEDKKIGTKVDIETNPEYSFHSTVIKDTSRFVLHFLLKPTVVVNAPKAVCSPSTVDLTANEVTEGSTSGLIYSYWLDSNATNPYQTPQTAESGIYYIKGTATNGTYSIAGPIQVTINSSPTIITNAPNAVCSPSTIDLTAPIVTLGSTPDLEFTYWLDSLTTLPYISPTTAVSGIYYIKGISQNGCFATSEPITVAVNPSPTIILTNPDEVTEPQTVDLTSTNITSGSTEGLTYSYWLDKNATIPYLTPGIATQNNYFIKGVVEETGCYSIAGPLSVVINAKGTDIPTDKEKGKRIYSFKNEIHLLNFEQNSMISIYDLLGREQYNGKIKSVNDIIYCNFMKGIYIVKVANNEGVAEKKLYIE